jgi:hypothetical protein
MGEQDRERHTSISPPPWDRHHGGAGWSLPAIGLVLALGVAVSSEVLADGTKRGITSLLSHTAGRQIRLLDRGPALAVETRSSRSITLVLDSIEPKRAIETWRYTLASSDDARFSEPVPAENIGYERQVVGFDHRRRPLLEHRLHVLFPRAMLPGIVYRLGISESKSAANTSRDIDVVFHPHHVSGSIQVNQVGYAPQARKHAYVGNWLGSAGPMPVDTTRFEVFDVETGEIVVHGKLAPRAVADPWSGNTVHEMDFSHLTRRGRYRVRVSGVGVSDVFTIAPDVYDNVYRTVMRLFYHKRNSTPILSPWADEGYARPEGGTPSKLDGIYHPIVGSSPLGRGEVARDYHAVRRGWFDAGDYGQYIPNAAPVWYAVAAALDVAPENFRDGDLGIPESGNGIPDVIDELEWGFDWALSMQDPMSGGVYFRIASRTWDEGLPHELKEPRYLAEKTTHATASFAAMAAIHARLIAPYDTERSERALRAAVAAWRFLEDNPQWPEEGSRYRNPRGIHAGEYADASATDNRLWSAAELYRTTGESRYHDAYQKLIGEVEIDPTAIVSFKDQSLAALWAYAMAPWPGRKSELIRKARATFLSAADWRIRKAREHPYRAPMHQHRGYVGWGSFAHSTRATLTLFQAYLLTGDEQYHRWAWQSPHNQLGANPQSLSYITGIGARSPRYPLSKLSEFDGVAAPLRGIPCNGPHFHLPELWPEMKHVNRGYFPQGEVTLSGQITASRATFEYPVLRRYTDSDYLPPMSEPTVAEMARVGLAFGLLRDGASTAANQISTKFGDDKETAGMATSINQ